MDFKNNDDLKKAAEAVLAEREPAWVRRLAEFLDYVASADANERATREFQQRIWEDNPVSNVGMGTVDISAALDDVAFRTWIAQTSVIPFPSDRNSAEQHIEAFFEKLVKRLKDYQRRTPWVKIGRVMAAFYPQYFTTITDRNSSLVFYKQLFNGKPPKGVVARQFDIRERIDEVLRNDARDPKALAERMTLPWRIYSKWIRKRTDVSADEKDTPPVESQLKPLPAVQRRKGLTSISGGIGTIVSAISFVEDGVSREELLDHLRAEYPNYRESSLATLVNILKNEFYVIQREGDLITPTDRGTALLETNDPEELVPELLTRTLGFDNALLFLNERGSADILELVELLKSVNPGWTTDFAPKALIKWLREFGLVEVENGTRYRLTESGRAWSEAIHWVPEKLPSEEAPEQVAVTPSGELEMGVVDFRALADVVKNQAAFPDALIQQLHFGLWSHRRRHFAIMAGLSGSGKTLLAKRYAEALIEQFSGKPDKNLFIQSVQPGWYDPTPLFGYVNPLNAGKYMRPVMLDVLLRAAQNPQQPFVIILDEMNLSHPEQYLAPILSAMESGDELRLHNEGDSFDGVPCSIPFPTNVAFIGTVNMDETTHGISDKVLDRAFTLEFWDIDLANYPNWGSRGLDGKMVKQTRDCLQQLLDALTPVRLHFGWRTVDDVLDYVAIAKAASADFHLTTALDEVVYAKVLPKLRGTETTRLRTALDEVTAALKSFGLEKSRAKVAQLKLDMADTGIMRFWR